MNRPKVTSSQEAQHYLSFQLQGGTYALEIELILEIRAIGTVTPLPGAPPYVLGIMNLRGALVPVIDLRARLGLPQPTALGRFAVTIIAKQENKVIGLVADGVNEVLCIPKASLQTSISLFIHGDQKFVQALALLPPNGLDSQNTATSNEGGRGPMVAMLNLSRLYDAALDTATQSPSVLSTNEQSGALEMLRRNVTGHDATTLSCRTETEV